ncbi:Hypothetical predicted protein [Octopus vulgaris]|uniref:Uncharacterized protein n=1 Tax=Octopus vulgaris TaxID=6645 RepID=A0AA36F0H2_OCTVU|nr:Hypothetical predicted protein [Octopus vulgaris]
MSKTEKINNFQILTFHVKFSFIVQSVSVGLLTACLPSMKTYMATGTELIPESTNADCNYPMLCFNSIKTQSLYLVILSMTIRIRTSIILSLIISNFIHNSVFIFLKGFVFVFNHDVITDLDFKVVIYQTLNS